MQIKNAFSQILCHANKLDIRYMYFVDDSDNHQNIGVTGRSDLNQTVIVDVMRILYRYGTGRCHSLEQIQKWRYSSFLKGGLYRLGGSSPTSDTSQPHTLSKSGEQECCLTQSNYGIYKVYINQLYFAIYQTRDKLVCSNYRAQSRCRY